MIGALKQMLETPGFHILKCFKCGGFGDFIYPSKTNPYFKYENLELKICKQCCGTGSIPIPLSEIL